MYILYFHTLPKSRYSCWVFAFGSFVSVRGTVRYPDGETIHSECAKPAKRRLITPSWFMGLCLYGVSRRLRRIDYFIAFSISLCALVVFSSPDGEVTG